MKRRIFFLSLGLLLITECSAQRKYVSLEEALADRDSVRYLELKKQHLDTFPMEILQMQNLEKLSLSRNSIKVIPKEISTLTKLHYIDLSQNYLTALPSSMAEMNIDTLILWDNMTRVFDTAFSKLDLKYLDLRAIQMTRKEQAAIRQTFPKARIRKDHPCNCGARRE